MSEERREQWLLNANERLNAGLRSSFPEAERTRGTVRVDWAAQRMEIRVDIASVEIGSLPAAKQAVEIEARVGRVISSIANEACVGNVSFLYIGYMPGEELEPDFPL